MRYENIINMHANFVRNILKIQNKEDVQNDKDKSQKAKVYANCKIRN